MCLHDQMLWRVGIGDRQRIVERVDADQQAVRQSDPRRVGTRQARQLRRDLALDRVDQSGIGRDKHDLGVGTMLGLRQQVRGDERSIRPGIRDHHDLRRPGRHVDGHALGCHLQLGFGDIGIAGTKQLVAARYRVRPEGHRRDRLRTAKLEHVGDAATLRGIQYMRFDPAVLGGRRAQHHTLATGQLCRDTQHQRRRRQRRRSRRHI